MAQREALHTIRAARAGHAAAQLELGKKYLFGGAGLPKNSASALYWLDRAAQQQQEDAWVLIGSYIPFETAQHANNIQKLCFWYQRAFEAGVLQAGIVFAKLVLAHAELLSNPEKRIFARRAIHAGAQAGIGEALWLWAQYCRGDLFFSTPPGWQDKEDQDAMSGGVERKENEWHLWAERAAASGVEAARQALEAFAWERQDYPTFLKWGLLPARAILQAVAHSTKVLAVLNGGELQLLKRCALALEATGQAPFEEIQRYWEVAAQAGDAQAQFTLGLLLAKMDSSGRRINTGTGRVIYKKALHWLSAASEQGMADAYYVISKMYLRPEFSRRNSARAQHYLRQAAQAGHVQAQWELGIELWRKYCGDGEEDVDALYWLTQAASRGNGEAQAWIRRVASPRSAEAWAKLASEQIGAEQARHFPYLAARVELALHLGLSRAEALLLDIVKADRGHCLVIDIRHHHPRSRRRLIAIQENATRQMVSRIRHLFHEVDCSENGPEGNYRQRLYKLKSLTVTAHNVMRAVPDFINRFPPQTRLPPAPSS